MSTTDPNNSLNSTQFTAIDSTKYASPSKVDPEPNIDPGSPMVLDDRETVPQQPIENSSPKPTQINSFEAQNDCPEPGNNPMDTSDLSDYPGFDTSPPKLATNNINSLVIKSTYGNHTTTSDITYSFSEGLYDSPEEAKSSSSSLVLQEETKTRQENGIVVLDNLKSPYKTSPVSAVEQQGPLWSDVASSSQTKQYSKDNTSFEDNHATQHGSEYLQRLRFARSRYPWISLSTENKDPKDLDKEIFEVIYRFSSTKEITSEIVNFHEKYPKLVEQFDFEFKISRYFLERFASKKNRWQEYQGLKSLPTSVIYRYLTRDSLELNGEFAFDPPPNFPHNADPAEVTSALLNAHEKEMEIKHQQLEDMKRAVEKQLTLVHQLQSGVRIFRGQLGNQPKQSAPNVSSDYNEALQKLKEAQTELFKIRARFNREIIFCLNISEIKQVIFRAKDTQQWSVRYCCTSRDSYKANPKNKALEGDFPTEYQQQQDQIQHYNGLTINLPKLNNGSSKTDKRIKKCDYSFTIQLNAKKSVLFQITTSPNIRPNTFLNNIIANMDIRPTFSILETKPIAINNFTHSDFSHIVSYGIIYLELNDLPAKSWNKNNQTGKFVIKSKMHHCSFCSLLEHSRDTCLKQKCHRCFQPGHIGPNCPRKGNHLKSKQPKPQMIFKSQKN
ncbi:hypothetical protein HYPBUDRAFT_149522 [Hyphopichia burtonii NRRL Y-1933]|uniref:CCHC-type domain-containing protein n=1 Tax=Hyphopichia burtonii NRRL Y-1933 TaxID=984485 RepID=A0A1E4RHD5_9ASCO|nr:hypothetical protein HYPBUDRAFT_149522 [Hyphopichia burtonii NRRL Y-1933]ODV66683.1 hypothetical protein HYPBUDRAFT_149522 [Hyphopichia burtonii NRRL Y-1933]